MRLDAPLDVVGQRAAAPFEIGRCEVLENWHPVAQMPVHQGLLDLYLLFAQPIDGLIDLIGADIAQPEDCAQGMASCRLVERSCRGDLRFRINQSGHD